MHGQFIWYELTTPDVAAAKKFYPRFTGWGLQPFDDDYTMWTTGGVPMAGLLELTDEMRQQGVPPNWMPYVECSDVDETAAKARSLGGRVVHGPADIPGTGRIAVVEDPQGAVIGVYKPANPGRAWDGTPVVGQFSWHELMTTDYRAAFEFYRALFGWEQNGEMDMGDGQMYSIFGKGDMMYGGMFNRFGDMQSMPPFWLVYINVKDVGEAVKLATKAGATVHRPQMDIPGGSIAILGDPQGAGFALHHVSAQPAAAPPASTEAASTGAKRTTKAAAKKVAQTATNVAKGVKKVAKKVAKKVTKVLGRATKKTSKTARTAAKKTTAKTTTAKKTTRKKATSGNRPKAAGKTARKATSKVARKSKPKAKAGARPKSRPARRTSTQASRTKHGRTRTARAKKR